MIKVFNATDKNYATHGDLILQPSKAVVHKEDNGDFYLDLETPLNEKEYKNTTPEAGQTAEGTSFSINVDTTKQYQVQTLKGQTSQSGTPTPSSPQPINITTGRQVVSVRGKNLLDISTITPKKFVVKTTGRIYSSDDWSATDFIVVAPNTTYRLSGITNGWSGSAGSAYYDKDMNYISGESSQTYTFNTPSNCQYIRISLNSETPTNVMLEKGSQATTYEEYKGNDYEINLGKNLVKSARVDSATSIYNVTLFVEADLEPSTTYTISFNGTNGNRIYANENLFTTGPYINITNDRVVITLTTKDTISKSDTKQYNSSYQKWVIFKNGQNEASANVYDDLMIEKGTSASSYAPYKTPIYLGKIGTYQDYIFRNTTENPLYDSNLEEGQWYIHKEIGKYVFTGNENFGTTNDVFYLVSGLDYATSNNIPVCTCLKGVNNVTTGNTYVLSNNQLAFRNSKDYDRLYLRADGYTTTTIKSALSGAVLYYVLATPTNTLIEDEELINQLNSIELLEGLNNVSVSSANLAGILQLKYNFTTAYSNTIKYIDYLVPNNILVANTPQGDQAFRITNIEKTRRKIKLKANHVFYDTMNYLIADSYVVDKNCNDALDHLNNATSDVSPFTTISDITNINSFRCVRKSLYEAIKVVLERWGGHLVRNDWTIGIYNEIGQDNGVTIRYAKNLKDISATYDWNDVVTKILPVGKDGILLNDLDDEQPLYIESTVQYDIPYTKSVSFEQNDINEDDYKDEEGNLDEERYKQALIDDLYNQAAAYVSENSVPKVNYNLSANVEKVSDVGDRIEVIDEKLGINLMTRIISYDYDCILEKYTNIEFGNFMPKLSDLMSNITASTEQLIQEQNSTLAITLNRELTDATDKIWNALGNSYVIYDGDKILIVDSLPKETARNVIMLNNGGIGFSNNGINGTFNSAWTIDNVLNMEQINVINLTADLIKGGTLKLGSSLNQNGQLEVYDEANNLLAVLDKNGLRMNGADGSYVIMNNDVGFAGFDRLNNKIYWVDKDVFHQKKSEVEEEITLVKKMRILPITITDSQNNIVNDGIGFVNVGGGN